MLSSSILKYNLYELVATNDRTLWQVCKNKDEAEIWFVALTALLSRGNCQIWRNKGRSHSVSSDGSSSLTERNSQLSLSSSSKDVIFEVSSKLFCILWSVTTSTYNFLNLLITGLEEHSSSSMPFQASSTKKIGKSIL